MLNSGHNRAAAWVIRTTGEDHEPRQFGTWGPKAVALIGKLPATLASRAVLVELRRMAFSETVEPIRVDRLDHLEPLARMAARWAFDNTAVLRDTEPVMPATLNGRRADNWRHLLALADTAGRGWPERARRAAEALGAAAKGETAGVTLLTDIRGIFKERGVDRIKSEDLSTRLGAMVDRPWSEWGKTGKPITQRGIAKLLEPFKIEPKVVRFNAETARGYALEWFQDVFHRYLAADPSVTAKHDHKFNNLGASEYVTGADAVTDGMNGKSLANHGCYAVTDRKWEHPGDDASRRPSRSSACRAATVASERTSSARGS